MKNILLILSLTFAISLSAQVRVSNNCRADIDQIKKAVNESNNRLSEEFLTKYPINTISHVDYLSLLVKVNSDFDAVDLEASGIMVGSRVANIVSLKFPLSQLEAIYELHGVIELQVAGKIKPELNKVLFDTKVDSVHRGLGLPSAFTGKDVFIGITDWGFDYSHPMFFDTLLADTRIFAAWDQFKNSGPTPADYAYGTEYNSPATLDAAQADTANIYSFATHGSHVAGIAGGSGAGTIYRGVAFESQFLFTTFLVDEGAILDAWEWMYTKSQDEGKRLVINMSWGLYHTGALDGTSILSQALDNYSDLGVVFVTSGGNNGNVDFHIKKEFTGDTLLSRIMFYTGATPNLWGQSIHAWGEEDESFLGGFRVLNGGNVLQIETPWYNTLTTDTYVDSFLVVPATTDTIYYNLSMDAAYPSNDRPQMRLRVKKSAPGYKIVLKSAAASGIVHYWNVTELSTDVGNWGMPFSSISADYTAGDNLYGIGAPACSNTAISVAAFSASFLTGGGTLVGGGPASFSSVGPMMNENLKPDIAAPGVSVGSSISSYTDGSYTEITSVSFDGRDYPFARFSGTSMSAPAVAGIAALMLEANPYLSPWQVKLIIIATAREDVYTGEIPAEGDTKWGWGKINAYAAIKTALATTGWTEINRTIDWSVYPNPTTDILNIVGADLQDAEIQVFDLSGKLCCEFKNTTVLNTASLTAGTYLLRIVKNSKVEQLKFVVQ
ncbi:MAG: minor extracellular serine protease Vpr [Crocinitomix sp.]|jgi:minor extracellular serine protease Vpr